MRVHQVSVWWKSKAGRGTASARPTGMASVAEMEGARAGRGLRELLIMQDLVPLKNSDFDLD